MLARRREKVLPRLRPGLSIKQVMIPTFFTARQSITLDAVRKTQKYNQEDFVQNILLSLLNEKKHFHARNERSIILCT
jgi:hypothetical protein